MATRAATFTAKIRNLKDYYYRLVNNISPFPSGVDIANTLKYFSQTLLSVLKDVPAIPLESYGPRQRDNVRLSVFPNLNYTGLYEAVLNMIDVVSTIQIGAAALGEAILNTLGCLVPFLEYDLLDSLPYTVATTLATFPAELHKDTIMLLCTNLLPVTLGYVGMNENPTYATDSTAAIIMLVFQYVPNAEYHSQLLECLMSMKKNIVKDLMSVIAYGPHASRAPAVNHLFHYWPQLNPALTDRRGIHYKYTAWVPVSCQREQCPNHGNIKAVKMCLDPAIAIQCGERPPPLYICIDCYDQLRAEHGQYLVDVLLPMDLKSDHVSLLCENKNCMAPKNMAVCTCFSIECASFNGNRPIRYCATCHANRHHDSLGSCHIFHLTIPDIWDCSADLQNYMVESIISLLKEAEPILEKRTVEMGEERQRHPHFEEEEEQTKEDPDDRKLLSRYGIWLLIELCKPKEDVPVEILGRLLAMLFQWFDATAYLPDDNVGNALERLKPDYISKWLHSVRDTYLEVVLACLLPHPVEYARVGGHWDTLAGRTSQIKEGLNRLLCLAPYDIVTFEVWDYVMPYWLEAVKTEVPDDELSELKVLLRKTFDIDMCPLSFPVKKMYHFMMERFQEPSADVQEQVLSWLQILTKLEIIVPLSQLLDMMLTGVRALGKNANREASNNQMLPNIQEDVLIEASQPVPEPPNKKPTRVTPEQEQDSVHNVTCFLMMIDLIIKQVSLQESYPHMGIDNKVNKSIVQMLISMLNTPWDGTHNCTDDEAVTNCSFCEISSIFYQLTSQVLEFIVPREEVKLPAKDLPKVEDIQISKQATSSKKTVSGDSLAETPNLTELQPIVEEPQYDITQLSNHLQLLYALLKDLDEQTDADALYYLLKCVKLLCLHEECLAISIKDQEGFIKSCLSKLIIPNLWKLLQAEHSHISSMCVPIMLHCLVLPTGSDIFWKLLEEDFCDENWKLRFAAVEKVAVLARVMDPMKIKNNQVIMTSLAHAFCCLIGALNDTNVAVVQRASTYLDTIKTDSIQFICTCLEFQFDSVISDRCMILQRLYQLSVVLPSHSILTWDFFLNRFDTLSLEAQLDLENTGDVSDITDLRSSDRSSETFMRKLNRARFALARTDSVRSISKSLRGKPPYRRAVSVPIHLVAKTGSTPKVVEPTVPPPEQTRPKTLFQDKEKHYPRQQSAPQFNLGRRDPRGSRFGLGMFGNYMFSGGHLREFTDEESNLCALLQRAMEVEGVDRGTIHQLVSLLMKFMMIIDQDKVNEQKSALKAQNLVLRHLNILLGYNQTEKAFSVPPYKVRSSTVFNSFLSGLPQILDKNFQLGNIILPVAMTLLQYCPSPQRYASDYQPPNYTLWYLEPHSRISWLSSLLVILYKYQYNSDHASGIIQTLIRITVNTIDAQHHRCRRHDDTFPPCSPVVPRTRDTSNVSIGDLENIQETDTPPQSPTDSQPSMGDTVIISMTSGAASSVTFRRKAGSDKSEKTDETDLESPTTNVSSIITESKSESPSKKPSSPSKILAPLKLKLSGSSKPQPSYDRPGSPVQQVEHLHDMLNEQTKRIAEHQSGSDLEVRLNQLLHKKQEDMSESSGGLKQKHQPSEKSWALCNQKTIEQSFEEHIMDTICRIPPDEATDGSTVLTPGSNVERKMEEQLKAFETFSDVKKSNGAADKNSVSEENVLKNGRESVGDTPSRVGKYPFGKAQSASVLDGYQRTREHTSAEFVAHGRSPERSHSEKGASATKQGRDGQLIPQMESELEDSPCPSPNLSPRIKPNFRPRRPRKTGLATVELAKMIPELSDTGPRSEQRDRKHYRRTRKADIISKSQQNSKKAFSRFNENVLVDRCSECNAVIEQYDEDTIGLGIIVLGTFIHREPSLSAPLLLEILLTVGRIASSSPYPWQSDGTGSSTLLIPGNCVSVARQFLRCVLHQLAPNGIFPQLFQTNLEDSDFLKTMAMALADFNDLNSYTALQLLLEGINERKNMSSEVMMKVVNNLATYMECFTLETTSPAWAAILAQFEIFFRRLPGLLPTPCDITPVLAIIINVLRIPGITSVKSILEPFSKLLSFTIQNCGSFKLDQLLDICSLCNRAFVKERDKLFLSRIVIFELVQALKFKCQLPDENLLMLVQFVCMDAGGTICTSNIVEDFATKFNPHTQVMISTNAAECMKQHLNECVDFIADVHTINKLKSNLKGGSQNLNEDTLGGQLKSGIAQFIALEFTRGNGRDNRAIMRYLPWLYHPPSAMQQGPKEFIETVGHIRLLSWLLLGSLTHTALTKQSGSIICQPVPLEASSHLADYIMVIMTGFAEQSKASVLHMSSLFHAFILCQLWTMYCESTAALYSPTSENYFFAHSTIMDFWGRVTPGILQLLSHSKVMAEMVNLHFLSMMEALQECNSTVLSKLFPMWRPLILFSHNAQLPGQFQVRMQGVQNWEPPEVKDDAVSFDTVMLLKWLKRLQFKLGQIEVQSSLVTQFYTI